MDRGNLPEATKTRLDMIEKRIREIEQELERLKELKRQIDAAYEE